MGGVRRVSVVGCSGAGKTTLGQRLAAALDAPFVELDGIFHVAGWGRLAPDEFRAAVAPLVAGDTWVIDGNYADVRDQVWARADTVVWLDLPRWRVMPRVVGRTVRRIVTRTELWNGNRETLPALLSRDADESVVLHAYRSHARNHTRYAAARLDPAWASLRFVQLTSPRAVRQFLATIGAPPA